MADRVTKDYSSLLCEWHIARKEYANGRIIYSLDTHPSGELEAAQLKALRDLIDRALEGK